MFYLNINLYRNNVLVILSSGKIIYALTLYNSVYSINSFINLFNKQYII